MASRRRIRIPASACFFSDILKGLFRGASRIASKHVSGRAVREPPERPGHCCKIQDWTSPRHERNCPWGNAKSMAYPLIRLNPYKTPGHEPMRISKIMSLNKVIISLADRTTKNLERTFSQRRQGRASRSLLTRWLYEIVNQLIPKTPENVASCTPTILNRI